MVVVMVVKRVAARATVRMEISMMGMVADLS